MCMYMLPFECMTHVCRCLQGQNRSLDSMELEFQVVVRYLTQVLGAKLSALTTEQPLLPPPQSSFWKAGL